MTGHEAYNDTPTRTSNLGPSDPGMRRLVLRDVLALIPFKKSWIYKSIHDGHFPSGHLIGRRRFWYAYEIEEAMCRLTRPAQPKSASLHLRPAESSTAATSMQFSSASNPSAASRTKHQAMSSTSTAQRRGKLAKTKKGRGSG